MGLFEWARNQFLEIIEWVDDSRNTLVYRFPVYRKEIKQGARLTVREGQVAIFVNEGQIADVFAPGLHRLTTKNLPVLATLKGWPFGFESPFKAEVYFVATRLFTNAKWGTPNPVMMRDSDFGMLRLRAFGSYAFQINNAESFLKQHIGTSGHVVMDDIASHVRNLIVSRFADYVAEAKIPALDLATQYDELAAGLQQKLNDGFVDQGMELVQMTVDNISLPAEVEQALDARTKMAAIGNLDAYTKFQAAESLPVAAANEGGMAGAGVGMGAGFAMGNIMGTQMGMPMMPGVGVSPVTPAMTSSSTQAAPAPTAAPEVDLEQKLTKLASLVSKGLITEEEAAAQRSAKILDEFM